MRYNSSGSPPCMNTLTFARVPHMFKFSQQYGFTACGCDKHNIPGNLGLPSAPGFGNSRPQSITGGGGNTIGGSGGSGVTGGGGVGVGEGLGEGVGEGVGVGGGVGGGGAGVGVGNALKSRELLL